MPHTKFDVSFPRYVQIAFQVVGAIAEDLWENQHGCIPLPLVPSKIRVRRSDDIAAVTVRFSECSSVRVLLRLVHCGASPSCTAWTVIQAKARFTLQTVGEQLWPKQETDPKRIRTYLAADLRKLAAQNEKRQSWSTIFRPYVEGEDPVITGTSQSPTP